jgi:catechol 2,3-dioxygenase
MKLQTRTLLLALFTGGLIMTTIAVSSYNAAQQGESSAAETMNDSNLKASTLTAHIEMGPAFLNVRDLAGQKAFYTQAVGLEVLEEQGNEILLGWKNRPILRLIATPTLPNFPRTSAGLYHTAIVFGSRSAVAQAVQRVLEQYPELYSGTSDHIVSEAFYFSDPEGNGLELYFDKDPDGWVWRNGRVQMGSSYIDPQQYIGTFADEGGSQERKMGHMHLQVGNIAQAKQFYVDILGMSITAEMPTALFVSDGKYHHHLGMNTWESAGAGYRTETLGLRSFEIWVEKEEDVARLRERLEAANWEFTESDGEVQAKDPWGNEVRFQVTPPRLL